MWLAGMASCQAGCQCSTLCCPALPPASVSEAVCFLAFWHNSQSADSAFWHFGAITCVLIVLFGFLALLPEC